MGSPRNGGRPAHLFKRLCESATRHLPFGLANLVAPNLVGFALINGFTFGVDIAMLSLFHGLFGWAVWLAITCSYLIAFGLSFVLNRWLNFRSRTPAGRQLCLYALTIAVNYVVLLLGVGAGLASLGLNYQLARLIAGVCEGLFMYCALRWMVFAGDAGRDSGGLHQT